MVIELRARSDPRSRSRSASESLNLKDVTKRNGLVLACTLLLFGHDASGASKTSTVVLDSSHRFRFELGYGWSKQDLPKSQVVNERDRELDSELEGAVEILARLDHLGHGQHATVVRVNYQNDAAWRGHREFFTNVERGLLDASPGAFHVRRVRGKLGRVPHLDVFFRQKKSAAAQEVSVRFLFFRRYTLIATIGGPSRYRRLAASAISRFTPYFL